MKNVFNLGIGLIAVISADDENKINSLSNELNEHPIKIGEVI
jgi:phosphoribosylaminoimidazole (AIR) synthetase